MPCHESPAPSESDVPAPSSGACSHCGLTGVAVRSGPQPSVFALVSILGAILPPPSLMPLSIVSHAVAQKSGDSSPPACNPVLRI